MTTARDREEWRRLAEAATPGPWGIQRKHSLPDEFPTTKDWAFITNARDAVPALLADVERLRAALRECADALDDDYATTAPTVRQAVTKQDAIKLLKETE